jgi:hypothetical protein
MEYRPMNKAIGYVGRVECVTYRQAIVRRFEFLPRRRRKALPVYEPIFGLDHAGRK